MSDQTTMDEADMLTKDEIEAAKLAAVITAGFGLVLGLVLYLVS